VCLNVPRFSPTVKAKNAKGSLIQTYATSIVAGLVAKVVATGQLEHRLTKGEVRELFVSDLLQPFLTHQFGIGAGVVVNQRGDQSKQTDIIIFDRSILPPFIAYGHLGVFPAESVVATIEVKSRLGKRELLDADESAKHLRDCVYDRRADRYSLYPQLLPTSAVLGFYGAGPRELSSQSAGAPWLKANIQRLTLICLPGKYSWINIERKGWANLAGDSQFEETKRFIAVLLDNLRTQISERTARLARINHKDWVSLYIRKQTTGS
jgi:hypothetical protein